MAAAKANQTQKELVRLLVMEHGLQKASELSGVDYELVRQWESRRKRKESKIVTNVTSPVKLVADRISDTLQEHERETRLSLARYARRAAKDSEQLTVREAPLVHKVTQVAGLVHKWQDEKGSPTFTLNVLNINSLTTDSGREESASDTIDA